MGLGRAIAAIFGILLGLAAVGVMVGGIALIAVFATGRDPGGFLTSPSYVMSTDGYALASERLDLAPHPADWWPTGLTSVRFTVEARGGKPVFVGVGPSADVQRYLSGVGHSQITTLGDRADEVTYAVVGGGAPATPPAEQTFWDLGATTSDLQTVTWELKRGEWSAVIMNADGSAGVAVTAAFGAEIELLLWIGVGLAVAALVLAALAVPLMAVGFRRRRA
jgi:hypothetical protein